MKKKGEYVTNPETKRAIAIGGRTYNRLLREGKIESLPYEDDRELDIIDPEDKEEEIKQKKKKARPKLKKNEQAVKGRGKYGGKIVKRYRKRTKKECKLEKKIAEAMKRLGIDPFDCSDKTDEEYEEDEEESEVEYDKDEEDDEEYEETDDEEYEETDDEESGEEYEKYGLE